MPIFSKDTYFYLPEKMLIDISIIIGKMFKLSKHSKDIDPKPTCIITNPNQFHY